MLRPAFASGIIPLAIHPAMTFTGTSIDIARLSDSYFAVTAPTPVLPIAQALVVEMGGEPVVVGEADRASYAEAVDTATAFATSIVEQATSLLSGIGIERPGAVIAPLVRSAMENALARTDHASTDRALLAELADFGTAADGFGNTGENGYGVPGSTGAQDPSATPDPDSSEDQ